VLRRAPWRLPRVIWGQLHVSDEMARFWAETHGLPYHNRRQVFAYRVRRLLNGMRLRFLRRVVQARSGEHRGPS